MKHGEFNPIRCIYIQFIYIPQRGSEYKRVLLTKKLPTFYVHT